MEYEHETPQAIASGGGRGDGIFFRRLGAVINSVEEDYDVVVIDAPPQLGYLTPGALCAATSLLITVHPAMIDVASMNQFPGDDERCHARHRGAWRYSGTRFHPICHHQHNPNDVPQVNVVALLRSLFGEDVLAPAVVDTTAIASAGLEKKSLYEMARGSVGRDTLARALDSVDAVNLEIFNHLKSVWGRS